MPTYVAPKPTLSSTSLRTHCCLCSNPERSFNSLSPCTSPKQYTSNLILCPIISPSRFTSRFNLSISPSPIPSIRLSTLHPPRHGHKHLSRHVHKHLPRLATVSSPLAPSFHASIAPSMSPLCHCEDTQSSPQHQYSSHYSRIRRAKEQSSYRARFANWRARPWGWTNH